MVKYIGKEVSYVENGAPIQSVSRIFSILERLAKSGPMGVTELSERLKLSKGTVHRMLSTLSALGYVAKDKQSDKYFLTVKFLRLSSAMLKHSDIRSQVRPVLEELSQRSGETVHFVKRDGNNIVYIDKVESTKNSLQMVSRIGLTHPLYRTGVGKAIMAEMTDEQIEKAWSGFDVSPKTEKTIISFSDFRREIEKIRAQGYAIDDEENELGIKCIAAAIADETGEFSYAFSISAPISRMDDKRIEELSALVLEIKNKL